MTYDQGVITFECGAQMKAPPEITTHFSAGLYRPKIVVIQYQNGEVLYYSKDEAMDAIAESDLNSIIDVQVAERGCPIYA